MIATQRFYIDERNIYQPVDLLYYNSLSGIETIRLRGEVQATTEYERLKAQTVEPPETILNDVLAGDSVEIQTIGRETFKADTGFMPQENLFRIRDLFLSGTERKVYEIKNNRLIPVVLNSKNATWWTSGQSLWSVSIEYEYAYSEKYYSPDNFNDLTQACPPVEYVNVVQSGANKLTVVWSLVTGYDKISINIGDAHEYILEGNTGQDEIPFVNPNLDFPGGIIMTLYARTVCNDRVDPIEVGAATKLMVRVYANSAPVAVPDTFDLPTGFSEPVALPYSVLDNDYDLNGDEFEAIAGAGTTNAGGQYTIDVDGIVTYLPPAPSYEGTDFFEYQIQEKTDDLLTATARCNINVTNSFVINMPIYIRLEYRDQTSRLISGTHAREYSERVFIAFFQDPLGRDPLDITGMGLQINVTKKRTEKAVVTSVTTTYTGIGTEMKIFDDVYMYVTSKGFIFTSLTTQWKYEFEIVPGPYYSVI